MYLKIVGIVFPIFAVVIIGYLYGRAHRPSMVAANQLNMNIFVPALVFTALAGKTFSFSDVGMIAIGGATIVLGSGLFGLAIARAMGYDPKTLVPPMMFSNAGNMGLPLLIFAFGETALPAAVILFLIENMLHFAISPYWLGHNFRIWNLVRVPVFSAGLVGLTLSFLNLTLWPPILAATKVIGDVSTGLMLFSLGVRLNTAPFAQWRIGLVGAIAAPLSGMIIAYFFIWMFDLSNREKDVLLTFGALPPAVLNFMFAEQFDQEPDKVASIVIMGTLASLFSVSIALMIRLSS